MTVLRASGSRSLVVPVQTAGLADRGDLAVLPRLHSPGLGAVHRAVGFVVMLKCTTLRRWWATVLGFTKARASCQPDHTRDSQAQSRRSVGLSLGRRPPL